MKVFAALLLTVFGWGSAFVAIHLSVLTLSPLLATLLRFALASIVALIIYFNLPTKVKISFFDRVKAMGCGLIGMGAYSYFLGLGEQTVPASITGFIIGVMPLCASVLATFLYKEHISPRMWSGIAISLVGLCIIAFSGHEKASFGLGLMYVFASLFCATAYTLLQKPLISHIPPVQFVCHSIWGGAFFVVVICFFVKPQISLIAQGSAISIISSFYLAIVSSILAFFGWSYALRHIKVTKASLALYATPIVSACLSWIILKEVPTKIALSGMSLALFGSLIGSIKIKRSSRISSEQRAA